MRKSRSDALLVVVPSVRAPLYSTTQPQAPAASQVGDPNKGAARQELIVRTELGEGVKEVMEEGELIKAIEGLFMAKLRKKMV